jgi:hypothetical protein
MRSSVDKGSCLDERLVLVGNALLLRLRGIESSLF